MCQKRKCNIVMNQQNKKTNTIKNKIVSFITHPIMLLLLVSIMVYGVFVPLLGYFWDDMGMAWNSDVFGNEGIARYFTTKRPVWAWFYQLSNLLLGKEPWQWQVFGRLPNLRPNWRRRTRSRLDSIFSSNEFEAGSKGHNQQGAEPQPEPGQPVKGQNLVSDGSHDPSQQG